MIFHLLYKASSRNASAELSQPSVYVLRVVKNTAVDWCPEYTVRLEVLSACEKVHTGRLKTGTVNGEVGSRASLRSGGSSGRSPRGSLRSDSEGGGAVNSGVDARVPSRCWQVRKRLASVRELC